jgi:hypothetical protein
MLFKRIKERVKFEGETKKKREEKNPWTNTTFFNWPSDAPS